MSRPVSARRAPHPSTRRFGAFTIGSAYVNHLDAETGTIEAGKLGNLVVLDRNLRAADAGPIGDASVRQTFVEGHEVFSA